MAAYWLAVFEESSQKCGKYEFEGFDPEVGAHS